MLSLIFYILPFQCNCNSCNSKLSFGTKLIKIFTILFMRYIAIRKVS